MLAVILSAALTSAVACPTEGTGKTPRLRALNILKNRDLFPVRLDSRVSLQAILAAGDDRTRWSNYAAGKITGYVADVKRGAAETCNCGAKDALNQDTHIDVALTRADLTKGKRAWMVVEVTPRIRKAMAYHGKDWSTAALKKLKGKQVTFTGWLMLDSEHLHNAVNTNPTGTNLWRATATELHPVTNIETKQ